MESLSLLQQLIATPRVSRDETAAADIMQQWMVDHGLSPQRKGNNLWCIAPAAAGATVPDGFPSGITFDYSKPTILLNAHIDTVKPVATWTRDPHSPVIEGDRLYGLGSNDCGGGLVCLLHVFCQLRKEPLPYNLIYLASCEEEVSGTGGIRSLADTLDAQSLLQTLTGIPAPSDGSISLIAIVGEPTGMQPAIAERGLMVIDGTAHGKSGHAARGEGINAISIALDDLLWIRDYRFDKGSPLLGPTTMQTTVINAGTQHNVVPDECRFIIDVRTNEHYDNREVFDFLQQHCRSELKARSYHLCSSSIPADHPLIRLCTDMGMQPFGSPTLSDQALMRFPSFKLGPGQSSRSHSADEFICLSEMQDAIDKYLLLLRSYRP